MAGILRLDILNSSGVKQHEITDFEWVDCSISVNRAGTLEAGFLANHAAMGEIAYGDLFELWRADPQYGVDWYRFFGGIYVEPEWSQPGKIAYHTILAEGYLGMLGWRDVGWRAGLEGRSIFTNVKAETIAKTLVTYNAAASATTANGRKRSGTISGVTVAADAAGGGSRTLACFGDNLLETLQTLAWTWQDGDFDLVRGSGAAWEFRWYAGQLGTDRSASVVFSMGNANMANPVYRVRRRTEKTVALVWGKGDEETREFTERTGANYSASHNREMTINASGLRDDAASVGDAGLKSNQASEEFVFDIEQTEETMYGVHYVLGDLTAAINPFNGASIVQKVESVRTFFQTGKPEQLTIRTVTR
jgi:hypothetical protein